MALVEHAPDFRSETERVGQNLKDDIPIRSAVAEPPQCSQTECVAASVPSRRNGPSVPQRFSSGEVTFASDDPEFGLLEHPHQERLLCAPALYELLT